MTIKHCLSLGVAFLCFTAGAAVEFDGKLNVIRISGFIKDGPLTLKKLRQLDKMNSWGKVAYDKETDTYTVNADLYIGKNDGTDTHVQIGTEQNPDEILVLNGNLVIHPFGFLGETNKTKCVNRLTIGDRDNARIKPTLMLGGGKGIFLGSTPPHPAQPNGRPGAGGELCIYNSAVGGIASNQPAGMNNFGGWKCSLEAVNAVFSNFNEFIVANAHAYMTCALEACTFAESGSAFVNSTRTYTLHNCTFRNLKKAAFYAYSGPVNADLTDCTLQNNRKNWDLSRGGSIKCTDCMISAPSTPDLFGWGINEKTKMREPAFFVSLRHIVVAVSDSDGKPVRNAKVVVVSEQNRPDAVYYGTALTGADGRTPGKKKEAALLLTEYIIRASDNPEKPDVETCSYAITVSAPGFEPRLMKNIKPGKSWEEMPVVLNASVAKPIK